MISNSGLPVGVCPSCKEPIGQDHPNTWCPGCGGQLPEEIRGQLRRITESRARIPSFNPDVAEDSGKAAEAKALSDFEAALKQAGPVPWIVYALLAINLSAFLAMAVSGVSLFTPDAETLFQWGGNFPPVTADGQWWRLLTSMFLHSGALHIGFNMLILWQAGRRMERILGHTSFIITYLLSGLLGSLMSTFFHPASVSIGASGAIFGIFGAMLGFLVRDRDSIPKTVYKGIGKSTLVFLGYNVMFALQVKNIDLSAHFGGLVGGFICGLSLVRSHGQQPGRTRMLVNLSTAMGGLLLLVFLAGGIAKANAARGPLAQESPSREDLAEQAKQSIQDYLKTKPEAADAVVQSVTLDRQEGPDAYGTVDVELHGKRIHNRLHIHLEPGKFRWEMTPASAP